MLKIEKHPYNSVLVIADSQNELAETFIRFQEHYESANCNFKDKIFTLGQLKNWYSISNGGDTYHRDWKGFNFPSKVLKPFREGLFDPLTSYESELLTLLKYRNDKFYIIGAMDDSVLRHELSHAMYFTDTSYRIKINTIFNRHKKDITKISNYILNKGYHRDVLFDELQAYITDNDDEFIISNTPKNILKQVNLVYNTHKDKNK